jgi:hypothetical protein
MSSQLLYLLKGDAGKSGLGSVNEVFYFLFSGDLEVINPYHDSAYVSNTAFQGDSSAREGTIGITIILMAMFLLFNIWILNIFISVISTEYEMETGRVRETFTQGRTGHILTYLLRKEYLRLPGEHEILHSKRFLSFVLLVSITICFGVTTSAFFGWKPPPAVSFPLLILAVFVWNLVQFQTPTPSSDMQYLWLLKDKEKEGFSWREEIRRSSYQEKGKDLIEERTKLAEEEMTKLKEERTKLEEERTKFEEERTKLAEERKQLKEEREQLAEPAAESEAC